MHIDTHIYTHPTNNKIAKKVMQLNTGAGLEVKVLGSFFDKIEKKGVRNITLHYWFLFLIEGLLQVFRGISIS